MTEHVEAEVYNMVAAYVHTTYSIDYIAMISEVQATVDSTYLQYQRLHLTLGRRLDSCEGTGGYRCGWSVVRAGSFTLGCTGGLQMPSFFGIRRLPLQYLIQMGNRSATTRSAEEDTSTRLLTSRLVTLTVPTTYFSCQKLVVQHLPAAPPLSANPRPFYWSTTLPCLFPLWSLVQCSLQQPLPVLVFQRLQVIFFIQKCPALPNLEKKHKPARLPSDPTLPYICSLPTKHPQNFLFFGSWTLSHPLHLLFLLHPFDTNFSLRYQPPRCLTSR